MTKGLISVIIPCYNVENFIDDCFVSLENQSYKNLEMIFVNDGSKDGTLKKIKQFCEGKSNCKIVDQQNQGLSGARNSGLAVAEGEFVCFVDPDDLLPTTYFSILLENLRNTKSDCSACQWKLVKEKFRYKNVKKQKKCKLTKTYTSQETLCQLYSYIEFRTSACNKLYKHSILQDLAEYPNVFDSKIKYGEDINFNFRYFCKIQKMCFTKQKLYYYRQRKTSLIHCKFDESKLTAFDGIDACIETAKQNGWTEVEQYARSCKGVQSMELLFRMHKSGYENKEKIKEVFGFLKESILCIKKSKRHPRYRRWFGWLCVPYFKIIFHKTLKK